MPGLWNSQKGLSGAPKLSFVKGLGGKGFTQIVPPAFNSLIEPQRSKPDASRRNQRHKDLRTKSR